MRRSVRLITFFSLLVAIVSSATATVSFGQSPSSISVESRVVPESPDFATRVFGDAWDMTEFSDISRDLNGLSTTYVLQDIQHGDGIFSAKTTAERPNDGFFALVYPGQAPETLNILNDGALKPIPNSYRCLYAAMKIESGPARPNSPEVIRAIWFADSRFAGGTSGYAVGAVHSEANAWNGGVQPAINWKLYRLRLDASPLQGGGTGWTERSSWQGLQINPVNRGDTRFSIDWARLTTCEPQITKITWTPDASVQAIWIRPEGSTRAIRVAPTTDVFPSSPLNGQAGSFDLDTQGFAAGRYQVGVSSLIAPPSVWSSSPLVINTAPIAQFAVPSPSSGEDYATASGNAWDFSDPADTPLLQSQAVPGAAQFAYQPDGTLRMTTPSGPKPAGVDTQAFLNMNFAGTSVPLDARKYRYLTFRIKNEWTSARFGPTPWANGGMLVRWNWSVPSISGRAGFRCNYGGDDIPMDLGWRVYTVDLHDVRGGLPDGGPIDGNEHCAQNSAPIPWKENPTVVSVRFDPNENISALDDPNTGGGTFIQTLDWVRLTKDNEIVRGQTFEVILGLNKNPSSITERTFYYTTDLATPRQNVATEFNPVVVPPNPALSKRAFLPSVSNQLKSSNNSGVDNPLTFLWDTTKVNQGTYYICADLSDGVNTGSYCSSVPVIVR